MKNKELSPLLLILFIFGLGINVSAQYDDVYYNPDTDNDNTYYEEEEDSGDTYITNNYNDNDDYEYFEEEDQHDYYYSSRIRRFHRPYRGFQFYDPCYVDLGFYDPFYSPYSSYSIYAGYNNYNSYNRWLRRVRHNHGWRHGYNAYSPSIIISFGNPYSNPYAYNGGYYNTPYNNYYGYGYNNYGYNNYYGNDYCPPSYYNNNNGYSNNGGSANNSNGSHYGPRKIGENKPNTGSPRRLVNGGGGATDVTPAEGISSSNGNHKIKDLNQSGTASRSRGLTGSAASSAKKPAYEAVKRDGKRKSVTPSEQVYIPKPNTNVRPSRAKEKGSRYGERENRSYDYDRPSRDKKNDRGYNGNTRSRSNDRVKSDRSSRNKRSYDRPSRGERKTRSYDRGNDKRSNRSSKSYKDNSSKRSPSKSRNNRSSSSNSYKKKSNNSNKSSSKKRGGGRSRGGRN